MAFFKISAVEVFLFSLVLGAKGLRTTGLHWLPVHTALSMFTPMV